MNEINKWGKKMVLIPEFHFTEYQKLKSARDQAMNTEGGQSSNQRESSDQAIDLENKKMNEKLLNDGIMSKVKKDMEHESLESQLRPLLGKKHATDTENSAILSISKLYQGEKRKKVENLLRIIISLPNINIDDQTIYVRKVPLDIQKTIDVLLKGKSSILDVASNIYAMAFGDESFSFQSSPSDSTKTEGTRNESNFFISTPRETPMKNIFNRLNDQASALASPVLKGKKRGSTDFSLSSEIDKSITTNRNEEKTKKDSKDQDKDSDNERDWDSEGDARPQPAESTKKSKKKRSKSAGVKYKRSQPSSTSRPNLRSRAVDRSEQQFWVPWKD